MDTSDLAWLAILFAAYLVRGITGFGSALVAVPLLAHRYPLTVVVPVVMVLDFGASFVLGGARRQEIDWREIRRLLPFGVVGAAAGVWLLTEAPSAPLLLALGGFVVFFGLRNVLQPAVGSAISTAWAAPAALAGGMTGALFGASAPPYMIYLTRRIADKSRIRSTFSGLFVVDGGFRLVMFAAAGLLLSRETMSAIALGVAPMLAGLWLGNRIHVGITREQMLRIVGIVLVASGISLLLKGLA